MRHIAFFLWVALAAACTNNTKTASVKQNEKTAADTNSPAAELEFHNTDSMEFIYYPDSDNQKLYKHQFLKDSAALTQITDNLAGDTVSLNACPHYSKFYLFRSGEVYKTIYVSDSCKYLAYAINSRQYFVPLEELTGRIIDSLVKLTQ
jgi:hypothetical protein